MSLTKENFKNEVQNISLGYQLIFYSLPAAIILVPIILYFSHKKRMQLLLEIYQKVKHIQYDFKLLSLNSAYWDSYESSGKQFYNDSFSHKISRILIETGSIACDDIILPIKPENINSNNDSDLIDSVKKLSKDLKELIVAIQRYYSLSNENDIFSSFKEYSINEALDSGNRIYDVLYELLKELYERINIAHQSKNSTNEIMIDDYVKGYNILNCYRKTCLVLLQNLEENYEFHINHLNPEIGK